MLRASPWLFGLSVLALSCSASKRGGFAPIDAGAAPAPDAGTTATIGDTTPPPGFEEDSGAPKSDCAERAKLVYVIADSGDLYSFDPASLVFQLIGRPSCPGGTPNSMAVARDGTAWVNYTDGRLYEVNTVDASSTATSFVPLQAGFTERFGMGYSSDSKGSSAETLFIADVLGRRGLAKVDLTTLAVTPIGAFSGDLAVGGELTGNADGDLWGFFSTQPSFTFAKIDKTGAQTSDVLPLNGVTAAYYAFSYWGGDFWFYTADFVGTTNVTRMETQKNNQLSVVLTNIGFRIVGAGVSTCAPTSIPK
jgi:hypothetical protein